MILHLHLQRTQNSKNFTKLLVFDDGYFGYLSRIKRQSEHEVSVVSWGLFKETWNFLGSSKENMKNSDEFENI